LTTAGAIVPEKEGRASMALKLSGSPLAPCASEGGFCPPRRGQPKVVRVRLAPLLRVVFEPFQDIVDLFARGRLALSRLADRRPRRLPRDALRHPGRPVRPRRTVVVRGALFLVPCALSLALRLVPCALHMGYVIYPVAEAVAFDI
jgi:hypothetical protein